MNPNAQSKTTPLRFYHPLPTSSSKRPIRHLRLGLLVVEDTAVGDALKDLLTVLVELELGDDDLGWLDSERDGLSVGLLAGDTLDVDDVLETVDGSDLALTALVGATDNGDLVVFADGDGADL